MVPTETQTLEKAILNNPRVVGFYAINLLFLKRTIDRNANDSQRAARFFDIAIDL